MNKMGPMCCKGTPGQTSQDSIKHQKKPSRSQCNQNLQHTRHHRVLYLFGVLVDLLLPGGSRKSGHSKNAAARQMIYNVLKWGKEKLLISPNITNVQHISPCLCLKAKSSSITAVRIVCCTNTLLWSHHVKTIYPLAPCNNCVFQRCIALFSVAFSGIIPRN